MNVLRADSIGKKFGHRRVLTAATLELPEATVTGLLGRMGAGKSTLLQICAGLVPPDAGWIQFQGVQYLRPAADILARKGLYYLAEFGNLAETLTVNEHFRALEDRFGAQEDRIDLQVGHLLNLRPQMLSGGERRRVELALAVWRNPRCLIMDEAFKGIDPIGTDLFGKAFRALAKKGCAVVIAGHEVRTLAPYVDRIVWVTAGTTHYLGRPADAWKNDQFRREYLGPSLANL